MEAIRKKLRLNIIFEEKECEMNIKIYQLGENEHIVIFNRKNDDIEIFYEYVSEIKDIIRKIFE